MPSLSKPSILPLSHASKKLLSAWTMSYGAASETGVSGTTAPVEVVPDVAVFAPG